MIVIVSSCVSSCKKDDGKEARQQREWEANELRAANRKVEREKRDIEKLKEKELKLAEEKAAEEAEKAKLLKEKLDKEKLEEAQKIAEEEDRVKQQEILKRQGEQKRAIKEYIGMKYDELKLEDGRVLESVKVTNANAVGVSFMHRQGVARVEYDKLPEEIREACMYDEELAKLEKERQQVLEEERKKEIVARSMSKKNAAKSKSSTAGRVDSRSSASKSSVKPSEPKKPIKPKGILSVRVVGTGKLGKKVQISAKTNVPATITLDGVYQNGYYVTKTYSVTAMKTYTTVVSNVKSKYFASLKGGGKLLDEESSGSKSGLREKSGL